MSAFAQGFQMGGNMFNQAERNRLLEEQNAREAEAHKQRMEEGGLRVAGLRRVDDASQNLDRVTRVGIQNPDAVRANDADFDMAVEATGRGLPMPAAAPQQPEWRKATGLEINDAQTRLAAAKGDVQGMEALRLGRKGMEYEDAYKKHFDDWNKMDDAAKSALIDKLSLDSGVKGFGSWVPGKGKAAGYMNYLPPGGDPIKLSAQEAGDLYVLSNLMAVDPMRARAEMDKVSDKVRAVAAQAFEAQTKGVTANNAATHYASADANDAARTAAQGQYYGVLRDRANRPQAGDMREFVNDKNEPVLVDITGLKRGPDGTVPLPAGLKPKNSKMVDPGVYWGAMEKATNIYGDPTKARMAVDSYFGLTAPTNDIAAQLKALDQAKSKGTGIKTQSAAAPAQPAGPRRGFEDMFSAASAELADLNSALPDLEAQASAAARSGDRNAIIQYGNQLNAARARHEQLTRSLGLYTN